MTYQEVLQKATGEGWSTGHFNFSESDQARAVCEAAKEVGTIAILGTSEGEAKHLGYLEAVALRDAFRKELDMLVVVNSDHHKSVETAKQAVDAGYDSIHIDLSAKPFEENVIQTKQLVEYAKSKNPDVSVEGELGYLRGKSEIQKEKIEVKQEDYTDPGQAKEYVERTGVDRLAIAVGNIHGISLDEPALDIGRIKEIRALVPKNIALVLHAGSGIPDDQITAAIGAGIANIHINTDVRIAYTKALREELAADLDIVIPYKFDERARQMMKDVVTKKLKLFGSKI
jgi:fructose-bisphosphate aldolase class II